MASTAKRAQSRVEALVLRRFREVLAGRRISQVDLAERVGLSREQLNRILNGKKPATFTEMVHISEALDLDLAALTAAARKELEPESPTFPLAVEAADVELQLRLENEDAAKRHETVNGE